MSYSIATSSSSSVEASLGDLTYDTDSLLDFDFDFSELSEDDNNFTLPEVALPPSEQYQLVLSANIVDTFRNPEEHILPLEEPTKVVSKPAKSGVTKLTTKKKASKKNAAIIKGMITGTKAPNMSRRVQGSVLCAFPTFDKCDSLVFLPNSISKFLNCGDIEGMARLLNAHTAKNCDVIMKGKNMQLGGFLYMNELIGELHPDTVSCVHTTKVVENTIQATLFSKYTDSDSIFRSVASARSADATFQSFFGTPSELKQSTHAKRWTKKIEPMSNKSDEEKQQLISAAQTPGDLVVYSNMYLTLTFDDLTRKVTKITYDFELTSLTPANNK